MLSCAGEIIRQVQLHWPDEDANSAASPPEQTTQSPPRKRRTLNSAYDSYVDTSSTNVPVAGQSAAAVVNAYIEELPVLTMQARTVDKKNYWDVFRADDSYSKLHPLMERLMCIPAPALQLRWRVCSFTLDCSFAHTMPDSLLRLWPTLCWLNATNI